eukprot:TRINITY_DN61712_c0_g1_i1.p3 TRINITY_DN61712_c0_g1~~TRINITY_DN61712_c0_g1_i1.p3  ORF type:complete len:104 (+),score=24.57 TRINITY_DN61712_c0_g1_i1:71-382(+)
MSDDARYPRRRLLLDIVDPVWAAEFAQPQLKDHPHVLKPGDLLPLEHGAEAELAHPRPGHGPPRRPQGQAAAAAGPGAPASESRTVGNERWLEFGLPLLDDDN